jgi:hypothetical protein
MPHAIERFVTSPFEIWTTIYPRRPRAHALRSFGTVL